MAKRELSTTLRNLKFMQRAAQREEPKPMVEDEESQKPNKIEDSLGASPAPTKRCIVIMEGNPHPGALKGRMSFQSFNPSIDKLHEEASVQQMQESNNSHRKGSPYREDGKSTIIPDSNAASPSTNSDHKRKQPEIDMETPSPSKLQKAASGDGNEQSSSQNNSRGKQQKREKIGLECTQTDKSSDQKKLIV